MGGGNTELLWDDMVLWVLMVGTDIFRFHVCFGGRRNACIELDSSVVDLGKNPSVRVKELGSLSSLFMLDVRSLARFLLMSHRNSSRDGV